MREIIDDPIFGKLIYHKKFQNSEFNGEKFLCELPFYYMEIRPNGDINLCCPQWNPAVVGNVLKNTIEEIWHGRKSQIIRNSILSGKYTYCNNFSCPRIRDKELPFRTQELLNEILDKSESKTPSRVLFVVDRSCNLSCPSCRKRKISQLAPEQQEGAKFLIRKVLNEMFSEPHDEEKVLAFDGSGEIFSSQVYRELFETEDIFTKTYLWPNLKFSLSTNGTLMTEKIQKKYKPFFNHITDIYVSIDAGNKESYEKVRVGGQWELLWENLKYYYSTKIDDSSWWQFNVIAQKNNYESIPELVKIMETLFPKKLPKLNISPVLNWGTWSEEQYLNHAVHVPAHPENQKYLEIINSTIVQDYLKKTS